MSNTGIICTIGPSSEKIETMQRMVEAGMRVVRLNFSHGDHQKHQKRLNVVKTLNQTNGHSIKILQDLEGFRIRTGIFKKEVGTEIELREKQIVLLTNQAFTVNDINIPLDYDGSLKFIPTGSLVYIDDGNIALKTFEVTEQFVRCEVVVPGRVKERKGINIPDAKFPSRKLTEKDCLDLQFGIQNKVDFIAQSFVRNRRDIADIRKFLAASNFDCQIIAKIENKEGIENLDEILDVADGIMIARGDLGVSLPIYEVPILQKMIIKKCRQYGKITITATQMLESMTLNFRPTRAEVSDVANAIIDGSDYVMLSGETAIGKYPVEVVSMMKKIIDFTEQSLDSRENTW